MPNINIPYDKQDFVVLDQRRDELRKKRQLRHYTWRQFLDEATHHYWNREINNTAETETSLSAGTATPVTNSVHS